MRDTETEETTGTNYYLFFVLSGTETNWLCCLGMSTVHGYYILFSNLLHVTLKLHVTLSLDTLAHSINVFTTSNITLQTHFILASMTYFKYISMLTT